MADSFSTVHRSGRHEPILEIKSSGQLPPSNASPKKPTSPCRGYMTTSFNNMDLDLAGLTLSIESKLIPEVSELQEDSWKEALRCPYHSAIMKKAATVGGKDKSRHIEMADMSDDSCQPALFVRADTGNLSTTRNCRCFEILQDLSIDVCREVAEKSAT